MNLKDYLTQTGMRPEDFGRWMTPRVSGRTVQRWLAGRIPTAAQIAEIHRRTDGAVRFEDWFPQCWAAPRPRQVVTR